jgi:hypothetical protein
VITSSSTTTITTTITAPSSERSTSETRLSGAQNRAPAKDPVKSTTRSKGKKKADEALSPDDVFLPKDIDLENGELDEFEKELEAFKRFCHNSVPKARKEKVNLNLKDIFVKKRAGSLVASASND